MFTTRMRDLLPAVTGVVILLTSVAISKNPVARIWPEKPQKLIAKEDLGNPDEAPIDVIDVKLRGQSVDINKPLEGDDEWIRNISFKLKNRTTKNITYVGVNLVFSDTSTTDPAMVRQLRFGRRPDRPDPTSESMLLKPNDSFEVSLPTQYESLKRFIEKKKQIKNINKAAVSVYIVLFEDGMKWDVGNFYAPDATEPSGFRKIAAPPGIVKGER